MIKRSASLLLLSASILTGCTTVPEQLQVPQSTPLIQYETAREYPITEQTSDIHTQSLARWGGVIANIENQDNTTQLEIVQFTLDSNSRPKVTDNSAGRFRVKINQFLDPMIYKEGRELTVVGNITRSEMGYIGKHPYLFPVLLSQQLYLWQPEKQIETRYVPYIIHTPVYIHRDISREHKSDTKK